jgi:hypothetical protein
VHQNTFLFAKLSERKSIVYVLWPGGDQLFMSFDLESSSPLDTTTYNVKRDYVEVKKLEHNEK